MLYELLETSSSWKLNCSTVGWDATRAGLISSRVPRRETILISVETLSAKTSRDLAQMAKNKGVPGWHSMRKTQLVNALIKLAKDKTEQKRKQAKTDRAKPLISAKISSKSRTAPAESAVAKKIRLQNAEQEKLRSIAFQSGANDKAPTRDRIVLIVRDSFWMQAYWEVTKATIQRVKVALGPNWHKSRPVLRLLRITSRGNTNSYEEVAQEIPIHGGASNWFINVKDSPSTYRIAVGYLLPGEGDSERFHMIAKSNEVLTPSSNAETDESWADITNDVEKYYSLSGGYEPNIVSHQLRSVLEEKSGQALHTTAFQNIPSLTRFSRSLNFDVDAHIVVHGSTDPFANVTIAGVPVEIESDGSFAVRMELPNKRQVLPVIASSRDGTQRQTTILAIERNTKTLEAMNRDLSDL